MKGEEDEANPKGGVDTRDVFCIYWEIKPRKLFPSHTAAYKSPSETTLINAWEASVPSVDVK